MCLYSKMCENCVDFFLQSYLEKHLDEKLKKRLTKLR